VAVHVPEYPARERRRRICLAWRRRGTLDHGVVGVVGSLRSDRTGGKITAPGQINEGSLHHPIRREASLLGDVLSQQCERASRMSRCRLNGSASISVQAGATSADQDVELAVLSGLWV
jgi:hypothetical protein